MSNIITKDNKEHRNLVKASLTENSSRNIHEDKIEKDG